MDKKFRGRVSFSRTAATSDHSSGNMATGSAQDELPWPSVAGPRVPENNPKLWKTPRLDMTSSLAFLRRELAAMQLQDRGIHKQLLALNSAILDLKTNLNELWDSEDTQSLNQTPEDVIDGEVLSSSNSELLSTQVSHTKQDSGILTDEDSGEDCDVFESQDPVRPPRRSRSVSCLTSGYSPELDINQNVKTTIKGYNLSTPRPRSHTVGESQFHRVTSMPVINEIPNNTPTNFSFPGKAFAIAGYVNRPRSDYETRRHSHAGFQPLSRHGSMPVISNIGRTSVRHVRSETAPAVHRRTYNNFTSNNHASSDKRTNKKPLYRIWRSSSQISLV